MLHQPEGRQSHIAEVPAAGFPFVQPGESLNLVADFDVAGEIGRFDPSLANAVGGLLFGAVVLRLFAEIHQPGGFPSDLPPQFRSGHSEAP
jgi:hypothetical protein